MKSLPAGDFEYSVEYQDWAASRVTKPLSELIDPTTPVRPITRSAGACVACGALLGRAHLIGCYLATLVTGIERTT